MAKKSAKRERTDDQDGVFEINEYELDREWIEQPKLYFVWAQRLADAKLSLEECKAELDVVKAELDRDIRSDPAEYDLEKVTESAIGNTILLQSEYKRALQQVHEHKHDVDILQAMVVALDHRKRALQDLVALHGQSYFATPQAPEGSRDAVDSMTKRASRKPRMR